MKDWLYDVRVRVREAPREAWYWLVGYSGAQGGEQHVWGWHITPDGVKTYLDGHIVRKSLLQRIRGRR